VPLTVPAVVVPSEATMLVESVDPAVRLVMEPAKPGVKVPVLLVYEPKLLSSPSEKAPAGAVFVIDNPTVAVGAPTCNTPKLIAAIVLELARL
jgi:hypothetical protein